MTAESNYFSNVYEQLHHWLDDVNNHEITSLIELVEQAKKYAIAAESLPQERVTQFISNLKCDLLEFGQQFEHEANKSLYLRLLKESWWQRVADISDKTQIEWAELPDDFSHAGVYHTGDFIGFGRLKCCHCHETITIFHFSEVICCSKCGHNAFNRLPLAP